jgi:hypothetical protein
LIPAGSCLRYNPITYELELMDRNGQPLDRRAAAQLVRSVARGNARHFEGEPAALRVILGTI